MGRPTRNSRIRTVKPEYWTDVKILDLSDSCALFFISLWNFCDDEGKIKNEPRQIAILTRRFTPKNIVHWTSLLIKSGLLTPSEDKKWLRVTGWSHQRIDRPTPPLTKLSDIKWINAEYIDEESTRLHDYSCRIGKDRKGKESTEKKEPKTKPKRTLPSATLREELLVLYATYPKKSEEDKEGIDRLVKSIKTEKAFESFKLALSNYLKSEHVVRAASPQFVKSFKSFAWSWKSWVAPATPSAPTSLPSVDFSIPVTVAEARHGKL